MYAEVILPVPLPVLLTYRIPPAMAVRTGMRVEVPLGKKTVYKGMVARTFSGDPGMEGIRDILAVLDRYPLVGKAGLKFWKWLAYYYLCTTGEG